MAIAPQEQDELYYRFEDVAYAGSVDELGDSIPGTRTLRVRIRKYEVHHHTPKGVWVTKGSRFAWHTPPKFVRHEATKKFAHPTVEEAAKSFKARKERQAQIHYARYQRATQAIDLINHGNYDE